VWNVVTGQPPESGIFDYDLAYFDSSDLSWHAEDAIIQEGCRLFGDLPAPVQIRNQARVHLWYEQKFGVACPPRVKPRRGILHDHGTGTEQWSAGRIGIMLSVPQYPSCDAGLQPVSAGHGAT
jgi:hypothetical protein